MVLEACVENIGEALKAQSLGAHRIELCDYLSVGGTTPSAGTIQIAKRYLSIPIMVLIRPRDGDFVYTPEEVEVMKSDIEFCKKVGVEGIVIGALRSDTTIDTELMADLIEMARPMQITFHKAIDETNNILHEYEKLKNLDIHRVLTSGGKLTAKEGYHTINEMIKIGGPKILVAGNITKSNLMEHSELIPTDEFHGKLIVGNLT